MWEWTWVTKAGGARERGRARLHWIALVPAFSVSLLHAPLPWQHGGVWGPVSLSPALHPHLHCFTAIWRSCKWMKANCAFLNCTCSSISLVQLIFPLPLHHGRPYVVLAYGKSGLPWSPEIRGACGRSGSIHGIHVYVLGRVMHVHKLASSLHAQPCTVTNHHKSLFDWHELSYLALFAFVLIRVW